MIVYVETNFPLELARQQEQANAAEQLLRLAESRRVTLAFPVFSICEPFSTLTYYAAERERFVDSMQRQLRELLRSEPHKKLASLMQPLGRTLLSIRRNELERLETVVERMLKVGQAIELSLGNFKSGRSLGQTFDLSTQDAIVYASILADIQRRPRGESKCFVSRNSSDFDDPSITDGLRRFNCRYIARFDHALEFARSQISPRRRIRRRNER